MEIKGIKIITHNACGVNLPDDPSFPFRLYATFHPPDFMLVSFILSYGGSEIICVRGETREALEQFVEKNSLRTHPRLRSLEITEQKPPNPSMQSEPQPFLFEP